MRKSIPLRRFIVALGIYIAIQSPWILFEFRHDFLNTKAAINMFQQKENTDQTSTLAQRYTGFSETMGRFIWTPPSVDVYTQSGQCKELSYLRKHSFLLSIIAVALLLFSLRLLIKDQHKPRKTILLSLSFLTLMYITFYSRESFEYYFLYFFPWVSILFAIAVNALWKDRYNILMSGLVALIVAANMVTLLTAHQSFSYADKMSAVSWVKKVIGNNPYTLEALGTCARYGGYRYLFGHFITPPVHSYMDSYFSWLYPEEIKQGSERYTILLSLPDPREKGFQQEKWERELQMFQQSKHVIAQETFGKITLYVFE